MLGSVKVDFQLKFTIHKWCVNITKWIIIQVVYSLTIMYSRKLYKHNCGMFALLAFVTIFF